MKSHSNSSVYCSRKSMWWINERHEQQLCMIFEIQFEPIWMVGDKTSSLLRHTLKIAWRVRRWRSVNTKRGFLGCCGCSGESSFLLQAEKYWEKRVFQQDSWNSSKSFFSQLATRCGGVALTSSQHLKNGCLSFNFLSCPSVTKCNSFFTQLSSTLQPIVDRISLQTIWAT